MRQILLGIGCLVCVAGWTDEKSYSGDGGWSYTELEPDPGGLDRDYERPADRRPRLPINLHIWRSGESPGDALEREITRLERLFDQGTPAASGRYGEVTARFGPQFSPYFQSQVGRQMRGGPEMPTPGTPEADALLVEMAGRALKRRNALVAEQLLALYELRAIRRLADDGVTPQMAGVASASSTNRAAARLTSEHILDVIGSVVKVATYRDEIGFRLQRDGGPRVLDVLTFIPDSPDNIILMLSLQATLQRLDDSPSTAALGLEIEIPERDTGRFEVVGGPTLRLGGDDLVAVRKGHTSVCMGDDGTWYAGLADRPRYTLRLTTPKGAIGGDVKVRDILVRVYYVTGGFIEAGTIR